MYHHISGHVTDIGPSSIVLENQGIGYEVQTSCQSIQEVSCGQTITLYTLLVVREDAIELVGFTDKEERKLYRQLVSVSKIGPKTALNLLSTYPSNVVIQCILQADAGALAKSPGLGKRGAERIILELKDKFPKGLSLTQDIPESSKASAEPAEEALLSLGFSLPEAQSAVLAARQELGEQADAQALIRRSLYHLQKR